jgi:succinoglycan biosynthesis protein ExoL
VRIAYFVHELADAAVQKRVRMLTLAVDEVTLLGFERDRGGAQDAHGGIVLGRTQNRKLLQRVFVVFGALPRAQAARARWAGADTIVARNLEMLALVVMLTAFDRKRPRIAYECLDIHGAVLGRGPLSALVRWVERACLKRTALIVTSSPAFERVYFRGMQRFGGKVLIVENKVLGAEPAPARLLDGAAWVIAWCGVLRCRRSFDLLRKIAAQNGRVKVELWGSPALDQIPHFHDAVAATPNMTFHGRYTTEALPSIYADAHFSWAIDFYEAGGNSDWLLPNRLYESLCFGSVPIAVAGVETARWLDTHRVGAVLDAPIENTLERFLVELTPEHYRRLREATLTLDPGAIRLSEEGCRAFAAELVGAAA